ncbi:hypothetical protein I6E81_13840 [Salinibacterium sp. NG22]|nr:hypothetical protein [Salinibacterium sp. NG22]MBH0111254.1 hypothetical protein [Salinibacterium sp. NG22]
MGSEFKNQQRESLLHEHADRLGVTTAAPKAQLSDVSARFLGLAKA